MKDKFSNIHSMIDDDQTTFQTPEEREKILNEWLSWGEDITEINIQDRQEDITVN